jgi:uncharacterized protein involved in type VI secretion and phage assembly
MCHSSAKPAPEPAKDSNHRKGYVSREKMHFIFDDEKKVILLDTPGGNKFSLTEDAKGIQLEDQNGNKIILDDSGIKIESAKDLTLKAAQDIKIEGNEHGHESAQKRFQSGRNVQCGSFGSEYDDKGAVATTVIQGGMVQIN